MGSWFWLKVGGRLDEATLSLGAKPVAIAADGEHVTVAQQPVQDCPRYDRVCKHHCPFGNAAVGRDQHRSGFVAPAYQLEEHMRRIGLEGQIAGFVDDQQLRRR